MTKNISFFNTLSNKKETFVPINKNNVCMYVCGPTVYDFPHIGNARPLVVFDVLFRVLKNIYGPNKVTYVRNITDIDDKIIESSQRKNITIENLTQKIIKSFHTDCNFLNCLSPTYEPKATDHIKEMITMVSELIKNKHAYVNNKHVYFSVSSFEQYGKLSNKNSKELVAGSRVKVSENKKNPLDFVLWKPSKENEPSWNSPWGKGRPGWHLECSAMSEKFLGKNFDIHGGGLDLVFPHHENEIAQSCCTNKTEKFANYWLHNGFVTFDKEKMSKSIGNIVTISDLSKTVNGQVIRLALLSSHYKQPLDWNEKLIFESQNTLNKWYNQYEKVTSNEINIDKILEPLLEDLNTPKYISKLHELYELSLNGDRYSKIKFVNACNLIGLLNEDKESWEDFKKRKVKIDINAINKKINDRNTARKNGNFKLADTIRKELDYDGVLIEDKENETIWKFK